MLNTIIPKEKYWIADYPNLDPDYDGIIKKWLWGTKAGIQAVCIDTTTGRWSVLGHAAKEFSAVYAGDELLTLDIDYTQDLNNAEIWIYVTPLLEAGTEYYLSIEGIDINAANYLSFWARTTPADGGGSQVLDEYYTIDNTGTWNASETGRSLCCNMWMAHSLNDSPGQWLEFGPTGIINPVDTLGDVDARSGIGQKFRAPSIFGNDSYLFKIKVYLAATLNPTGIIRLRISTAANDASQFGAQSNQIFRANPTNWMGHAGEFGSTDPADFCYGTVGEWPLRESDINDIRVNAIGRYDDTISGFPAITNIADVTEDIILNILGAPASSLNNSYYNSLRAAKTEEISFLLENEMRFREFLDNAEMAQRWRLLPDLSRKYRPRYFNPALDSGEDPLHLMDEDFVSFKMYRDFDAVRQICKIKYDHDPEGHSTQIIEESSAHAKFFYNNEETLEFDAYTKDETETTDLALEHLDVTEEPPLMAVFEVKGHGMNFLPMDRVYITRNQALYENGKLEKVLFRIIKIQKKINSKTTVMTAVLDTQVSI